ncbi:rhomboid family intramembrane serine protease [Corynebacterium sp. 4HC-13]|uniref:rhomboid family intramembrane serine protease n=1 Tax=Corynebacterium anserum TaxID=2684406 RepID=UPI001639E81C|nr:rhomboid family intramembrane serine protease [Corynebacterium anserum]MBC2682540.1 rhomboid family intramembrane serine protease [Corynebacterium anserum]
MTNSIRQPGDWGWFLLLDPGRVTAYGQWWRVFTSALVHLSLTHLLFNMLLVFLIGRELERFYGSWVIAGSMVAGVSGGAMFCMFMEPYSAMGGASTVGFAFCVMLLGLAHLRQQDLVAPFALILINFGYTFTTENVSAWAHIGGAVAGAFVSAVLRISYLRHNSRDEHAIAERSDRHIGRRLASQTGALPGARGAAGGQPGARGAAGGQPGARGAAGGQPGARLTPGVLPVWIVALTLTALALWVGFNGVTTISFI